MATRERKRLFCGHCKDYVSKTLYHKHKQLYYTKREKKWCEERVVDSMCTSDDVFTFSDGSGEF